MSNPNLDSHPQQTNEPGLSSPVTLTAEQILELEKKARPLILDPIIISSFGEFQLEFRHLLNSLCKVAHDTAQSKKQGGPGG
jgi:hypothetical protein